MSAVVMGMTAASAAVVMIMFVLMAFFMTVRMRMNRITMCMLVGVLMPAAAASTVRMLYIGSMHLFPSFSRKKHIKIIDLLFFCHCLLALYPMGGYLASGFL